eukprot:GHVN01104925.1.p1 GENE.GHVN01104925.1~~GHVN01104925.1.p1  ORF type:complete len:137 (+),score=33.79 GHVN01104925.1:3-413(+)
MTSTDDGSGSTTDDGSGGGTGTTDDGSDASTTGDGGTTSTTSDDYWSALPIFGATAGAMGVAMGVSGLYFALAGKDAEEEDIDEMSDIDETVTELSNSFVAGLESDPSESSVGNYVDVDPDNSFWRGNTVDMNAGV